MFLRFRSAAFDGKLLDMFHRFSRAGALIMSLLVPLRSAAEPPAPITLRARYGLVAPTTLDPARSALVLVDFQREFFAGGRLALPDAVGARQSAERLLAWARTRRLYVVHVRNVATRADAPLFAPTSPGSEPVPELLPHAGEHVIIKSMAGAFSRTELDAWLRARGVEVLVVAGLMTHLAVDSTARDATVLGYRVLLSSDASSTRALPDPRGGPVLNHRLLHRAALAALADRFADVMPTAAIIALPTP